MNLFELSAKLQLDSGAYEQGLKRAEKLFIAFGKTVGVATSGVSKGLGKIGSIGKGLSKIGSIGTVAFSGVTRAAGTTVRAIKNITTTALKTTTALTGIGTAFAVGIVKSSVKAYASYEQLVGGIETLFKESSILVIQDARQAYKTAQMSANQYMDIATSFAASLIQSVSGDTRKAAELTNKAVIDMADNANKMGTDMESIENAYRGFSKQNFTMLDNLKLGYGGTKKEMERLLEDAEKITGKKYDISNFGDIIEAIHVIQEQLGITGSTAEEAANTISGSFGMVKASWQNLVTAMADRKSFRHLKDYAAQFADSVKTAIKNLAPAITNALIGASEVIKELSPVIAQELPNLVEKNLPILISVGIDFATAIVNGIGRVLKPETISRIFKRIKNTLKLKLTDFLGLGSDASGEEVWAALGKKIRDGIKNFGANAKITIADILGVKTDDPTWEEIGKAFIRRIRSGISRSQIFFGSLLGLTDDKGNFKDDATWADIGAKIFNSIVSKAQKSNTFLKQLLVGDDFEEGMDWGRVVDKLWKNLHDGFSAKKLTLFGDNGLIALGLDLASGVRELIIKGVQGVSEWLSNPNNQEEVSSFIGNIGNNVALILTEVGKAFPTVVASVAKMLSDALVDGDLLDQLFSAFNSFLDSAIDNLPGLIDSLGKVAAGLIDHLLDPKNVNKVIDLGNKLVSSIVNALPTLVSKITSGFIGMLSDPAFATGLLKLVGQIMLGIPWSVIKGLWEGTGAASAWGDVFNQNYTTNNYNYGGNTTISGQTTVVTAGQNALDYWGVTGGTTGAVSSGSWKGDVGRFSYSGGTAFVPAGLGTHHAKGLWDVPYDDYTARLHRNEMVLTASQARQYREGDAGNSAIVGAIQELRNDMMNLRIMVGEKVFGRTVVQYGGKRMNGYLGNAEDRVAAGYGWG